MSRSPRPEKGITAHRLSSSRLYGIVLLFLVLAGYAIWKSERFQNLIQGVSQARLSQVLGVPVSFDTVSLRFLPPSVRLANVRIGNDPSLKIPEEQPLLEAEELTIGGGVSLVGRELRLGRIRAVQPHLRISRSNDGRYNIPPGLGGPSRGGLQVHVGSLLVQQGVIELEEKKAGIDGRFDDFAAEITGPARDRYVGRLLARRASIRLPGSEPLVFALSASFRLEPSRGLSVEDVRIDGAFGRIRAVGEVQNLSQPRTVFSGDGEIVVEEVERLFRSPLGFSGRARVHADLDLPPSGGFRMTGKISSPRIAKDRFEFTDVAASVLAGPEGLVGQIEQAAYAGGRATGVLRIGNLTVRHPAMSLALDARGLSLEHFFGDIDLKGTGLSGSAALQIGLRWGEGGLEHADGGGTLEIEPGPAVSLVRGRFGLPVSGGGPLAIVDGRIGFERVSLHFPQSSLDLSGRLAIGKWQPDFDVDLKSRDLTEVDRLFQNFLAATGGKSQPLGLGGSGEVQGHLAGTWSMPEATLQVMAEDARFANVGFGSVRGTVDMRDGAFFFRPLRVYDGDASLALEGMARYQIVPGRPRFDLQLSARRYPLSRVAQYLDLHYPVDGKLTLTGSFPVSGTPEALTGGGPIELADAIVSGEKIPLVRGTVRFTPGRFSLEDVSAEIGGGLIRGQASLSMKEKTFDARAAGDAIALESIEAARSVTRDVTGKLSFQITAGGSLDHPDLKGTASLSDARFFGHDLPESLEPRVEASMTRGVLDATVEVREHWSLRAHGDLFGSPARIDMSLDAADLAALLLFTPVDMTPGRGGALAAQGSLTLPAASGAFPTGSFTVTRARLDLPDRKGVLSTSGAVRLSLADGKLAFQEFTVIGEATSLKVGGQVALQGSAGSSALAVSGTVDASALTILLPDAALQGKVAVDLRASGTFAKPVLAGSVRIENGKYRLAGLGQFLDEVQASVTFHESGGDLEGRARFGGGDVFVGGNFSVAGTALQEFRVSLQGRKVRLPGVPDLRLIADADLVATGGPTGNSVRGEIVLLKGTYDKDFDITLSDLLARTRPAAVAVVEAWKQRTTLEVRIISSAGLDVRNSAARLTGSVDLIARGTVAEPTLLGQIVLDEGGRLTFRDVRYDIEAGTVTFASARGFAPILDIRARAEVKGYDLVVSLAGTWPRIQATFSADPPLPDETILSLLLTGTAPSNRPDTDTTSSIVSVGAGLAAGAVTGGLTRGTQRLFKLDRFAIDPVFSGGQLTDVRSTISKQITPDIFFTYSQSVETSKLPIVELEWRVSNTLIVRAQRDENGIYLIDIRHRQRL